MGNQRQQDEQHDPWDPLQVTHADAVANLFPEIAKLRIRMDQADIPGRSWPAGMIPPCPTDLDKVIAELLARTSSPMILSPAARRARGLHCPFYAARIHTAHALSHANENYHAYGSLRRKALIEEKEEFRLRASQARKIIRVFDIDTGVPRGNLYFCLDEPNTENADKVRLARLARFTALKYEAEQDEAHVLALDNELKRLASAASADVWRTSFLIYMANLWTALTDVPPPDDSLWLKDLLTAATKTLAGGTNSISGWGQTRTLRGKFKDAPSGEGFRIYEDGTLALQTMVAVADRGAELATLAGLASNDDLLCRGALLLIDYSDATGAIIIRETVLKPRLMRRGLLTPHLKAQLGWIKDSAPKEILKSLVEAIEAAQSGDRAAAAIMEIASKQEGEIGDLIRNLGWSTPYSGIDPNYILDSLEARLEEDSEDDNDTAFCVAMQFLVGGHY